MQSDSRQSDSRQSDSRQGESKRSESRIDRRNFLATALTAASSTLMIGSSHAEAQSPEPNSQLHPTAKSPLSFESLYDTSILATTLKGEAADRLALRRLVDAWAHCADRRLAETQSNLFVPDGTILNYEGKIPIPTRRTPQSKAGPRSAPP